MFLVLYIVLFLLEASRPLSNALYKDICNHLILQWNLKFVTCQLML
jgi:hypothetical protein